MTFTFNDLALISATLLGPVLAVQAQRSSNAVAPETNAGSEFLGRLWRPVCRHSRRSTLRH